MKFSIRQISEVITGDPQANKIVPPTGYTARLTVFTAAAMAFLAVFAMALSLATGRLADRWSAELARTSTLRISAPVDQADAQLRAAINVLETTPGVAAARALTLDEQRDLLEPWFGPDLPLEALAIPQLVEIIEEVTVTILRAFGRACRPRYRVQCWMTTPAGGSRWSRRQVVCGRWAGFQFC